LAEARRALAVVAVALALAAALTQQVTRIAPAHPDSVGLFSSIRLPADAPDAWRGRLAARELAVGFVTGAGRHGFSPARVGLWSGAWFLVTALVLLAWRRRSDWIWLYLFGTFAAVSSGYFLDETLRVYPWDLPALCCFTLAIVAFDRGRGAALVALVPLAVPFKETALLLPLLLLFLDRRPRARRLGLAAAALALGVAARVALNVAAGSGHLLLNSDTRWHGDLYALVNLHYLLASAATLLSPLAFDAGLLLVLALLPPAGREGAGLRALGGAFALAVFAFARLPEARIWFDLVPAALLAIELQARARGVGLRAASAPALPPPSG